MAEDKRRLPTVPEPHFADALERACPIPATHRRLDEVHYFWHKTAEAYNDPEVFRFNLNALIQAARNVTFALQSEKERFPTFGRWYEEWQEKMRADEVMRWLHDARTTVVKRGDLDAQSVAKVVVLTSYAEPPALEVRVPPSVTLEELFSLTPIQTLPPEVRASGIVVIERRWITQELATREVLDALAYVYGFLYRVVADAHELCGSTMLVVRNRPTDYRLPCMVSTDIFRSLRVNLRTGAILTPSRSFIPYDPKTGERAAARYGIQEQHSAPADPFEYGAQLLEIAMKVLARDKRHIPILFLHHPERGWVNVSMLAPEDPEDKLLLWRGVATEVEAYGFDAYAFISEAWLHQLPNDLSKKRRKMLKRRREEALTVTVETADGKVRHWIVPFRRRRGEVRFEEMHTVEDRPFSSEPVRQAWARMFGPR